MPGAQFRKRLLANVAPCLPMHKMRFCEINGASLQGVVGTLGVLGVVAAVSAAGALDAGGVHTGLRCIPACSFGFDEDAIT